MATSTSNVDPQIDPVCISGRETNLRDKEPNRHSMNEPYTFFNTASLDADGAETPDPFRHPPRVERATWCHEL